MSAISKFNDTVRAFVKDLRGVFGEHDAELTIVETTFALTKFTPRLFLDPFQKNLVKREEFVERIMKTDTQFFIDYDFMAIIPPNEQVIRHMFRKFKTATIENQDDEQLVNAIYNWLKVMIYYAKLDMGVDLRGQTQQQQEETQQQQQET